MNAVRTLAWFALALIAVAAPGCGEVQPPIQRVGNEVLEKSAFEGEWYYLQTVIDTPYQVGWATAGDQSLLERIEWDIQERYLIVRRSYEFIPGAEPDGIAGTAAEPHAPIAMFEITSHFDIRRTYNTITGEEENVIVENDTDRPWQHRQFMRVDWSRNLISDGDALTYARVFDGVELESVAYHINDPSHPDAPRFAFTEDGTMHYVDVVSRAFVRPTEVEIDGWSWPTCWLEYSTHIDCAPMEIGLRHSFLRVDPEDDYQPLDYSGDRMERFGYFVTERPGYDPEYGAVEPARRRWINRHDLWAQSYRRDDAGAIVRCTTDAECDDGRGSSCDVHYARAVREPEGACTIAYRDRVPAPIAYHLTEGFPTELLGTATEVIAGWNEAFVETVASLRENECLARGGGDCAAERTREDAATMFVLCHNPVVEEDHDRCGEVGEIARLGDLRYSILGWVPEAGLGSPLGYGPSAADPLTGELINATTLVYGAGVDTLASHGRDLVAVLNGDLSEADVIAGEHVRRWVERDERTRGRGHAMDATDLGRVEDAIDVSRITGGRRGTGSRRSRDLPALRAAAVESLARRGAFGRPNEGRARLDALRDTPIEAQLLHHDLVAAAGVDPDLADADALREEASPLRGASLRAMRARHRARRRLRAERCDLRAADFVDDGLLGLARAIQRAATSGDGTMEWYGERFTLRDSAGGIDYEAVRRMLRVPIFHSTASHEVGHTVGLRHNFSGSYDAINYRPEYWASRDDGMMRARPFDPLSDAEIDARQREFQYSTVMDYGNNYVVTDANGLGHYDHAAIKMGYGDLVEVFEESSESIEVGWIYFQQLFGWPGPLTYDSFFEGNPVETTHYTALPALVGGVAGLERRADVPYASLVPEPTLEADDGIDMPLVDAMGRPAVPYRFCSDEQEGLAPDCQAYDAGGDDFEAVSSVADTYWSYYLFNNFRRERLGFDDYDHYDRVYWRYMAPLQSANQMYVFNRTFLTEIFGTEVEDTGFFDGERGFATQTLAAGAAFDVLRRVVTAPEPGGYVEYILSDGTNAFLYDEFYEPELTVDELDGRYLATTWDFDAGYYWFDQLDRVGYFVDKVLALQALVDPETGILGQDTDADVRAFQINFASTFPDAMNSFLAGILAEDYGSIGPREGPDGLEYPDALEVVDGSMPGTPIAPNAGFSVQLYASTFGMAWIPATFDDVFFESARIYVAGSAEEVMIPAVERVSFRDPFTSLTYLASSYPDEAGVETGVAARMLGHAIALEAAGDFYELDRYMDLVRFQRSLSWVYSYGP